MQFNFIENKEMQRRVQSEDTIETTKQNTHISNIYENNEDYIGFEDSLVKGIGYMDNIITGGKFTSLSQEYEDDSQGVEMNSTQDINNTGKKRRKFSPIVQKILSLLRTLYNIYISVTLYLKTVISNNIGYSILFFFIFFVLMIYPIMHLILYLIFRGLLALFLTFVIRFIHKYVKKIISRKDSDKSLLLL